MKNIKVIIAGVAIVAALGIFIMVGSGEESIPDTDDTRTDWICLDCNHPFTLTAGEYESVSKSDNGSFVKCSGCGNIKGVRAATCPSCQSKYATMDANGKDATCTKCNPVVVKSQAAPEEQTPEPEAAATEEEAPAQRPIIFSE